MKMNKNEKLIESITGFFITMGKRDGHRSDHILSLLREIHFTALYHAICENTSQVYSFAAISDRDAAVLDIAENVLGCFGKKLYGLFACESALK
jgi:hypothetical protein